MRPALEAPKAPPSRDSLAFSAVVHAFFLGAAALLPRLGLYSPPPFEIEITDPYLGDGPAKLGAPKAFVPGAVNRLSPREEPRIVPPKTPAETAPEPPKDWTLPGPETRKVEPAPPPPQTPGGAEGGTGTSPLAGGSGEGADFGVPGGTGSGGTRLLQLPKLLNAEEVLANLRRFYPERERRAGKEADVGVMIHIGLDGVVSSVDVTASGGGAFDEAAQKVCRLMRFSPAIGLNGKPVPVRLPQPIQFRLTD